jgi:hypothetical protein
VRTPRTGIDIGTTKSNPFYIVVAPSIHPESGKHYAWVGEFDLDRLAEPPDWLPSKGATTGKFRKSLIGLNDDLIYHALSRRGLVHEDQLGPKIKPSRDGTEMVEITCPWVNEHSGKEDHGTAYFAGGGFKCLHAHCDDRHNKELEDWLRSKGEDVDQLRQRRYDRKAEVEMIGLSKIADDMEAGGGSLLSRASKAKPGVKTKSPPNTKSKAKTKTNAKSKRAPASTANKKTRVAATMPAYR